jgi:hypothetical protein
MNEKPRSAPQEPHKVTLYRDKNGKPLKTELAEKFPLLTRHERREIQRKLYRQAKKQQKGQQ